MKPRMWIANPQLEEASHFVRSILSTAVASKDWHDVWPLVSVLYNLDEEETAPSGFRKLLGESASAAEQLRAIERWAEQAAKPSQSASDVGLVIPSAEGLHRWLVGRVRAFSEFNEILTEDPKTLLALARGADIALAVKAQRLRTPDLLPLPLVIQGPTGAGKELLARALHAIANGKAGDFGPVNCGGLPSELIESELFGHTAEAFTGATKKRPGIIETHGSGSVFLDEIGDTPVAVQVRLLRFLNDGEVRPVGADVAKRVSPWVICATHRDLAHQVGQNTFREDLFFRLMGNAIELPALAMRRADVLPVLKQCLERKAGRPVEMHLVEPARIALQTYTWPGNLRELSQLAGSLVSRLGKATSLVVEVGMLPVLLRHHYFTTRGAADQVVDLYTERARLLDDPQAQLRSALVTAFESLLNSGVHPEVRFALFVEGIVGSPFFAAIVGEQNALQAHAVARYRREQAARKLSELLHERLAKIDGLPIAAKADLVVAPPSEEGLPKWLRHLLTLGEEASLDSSNFVQATRLVLAQIEALSPTVRSAIGSLVAAAIEDIKASSEELNSEQETTDRSSNGPHHKWDDVKKDRSRFEQYLRADRTAVAMARTFGVSERTVRAAAQALGVDLRHGGARETAASGSNRKATGRRETKQPRRSD